LSKLKIETSKQFQPLLAAARYKGAHGGRGSGKSHFFAENIIAQSIINPGIRVVCVREVQKTLKESAKKLLEDKIESLGVSSYFEVQNDRIKGPNDGAIIFQGLQDHNAESIKSLEGMSIAWIEEAQTLSKRSLELLRPTIRAPGSEIWASWNPRLASDEIDTLLRGEHSPSNAIVVQANYDTNPWFPKELEDERVWDYDNNPDRYAHIWLGEYEPQAIGAIWNRQKINENRRKEAPEMARILVGVDPAVTDKETSDNHGIVVAGLGRDQRGYVLDDVSSHGTPHEWATKAITAYDKWEADAIVIEVNQGGDMVKHTINSVRPGIRIVEVRATRGKHVRAEPISALYAMDQISHVGTFRDLESEMCLMTASGYDGQGSPDRCDALVWAFTELFPKLIKKAVPKALNYSNVGII
tara:strand:- start:1057 stop:2295 length:1239 start_codon:yes stop_codon:yes gene_type:complete